jgi:hypothetical protein
VPSLHFGPDGARLQWLELAERAHARDRRGIELTDSAVQDARVRLQVFD